MELVDTLDLGSNARKCIWRLIKNEQDNAILSIVNVGKESVELTIKNSEMIVFKNKINGAPITAIPRIEYYDVLFVEELKN